MTRHGLWICLLAFAFLIPVKSLHSQTVPPSCDANYYEILRARSFLEGQREMEAAQRLILKADSVLEYSCFHIDLAFAGNWGATFSENGLVPDNPPEFDGGIAIYGGSLDAALGNVVEATLVGFMDSFSHIYGGGTYTVPVGGNICNPMNVVWAASKCANFDPNWFVTMSRLAGRDIRTLPLPCSDNGRTDRITAALEAAYPDPETPPASGSMAAVTSYIDNISGACTGESGESIPTGILAISTRGNVDSAVCLNPRCFYNGTGCQQ
jgi:hypothetical protein